MAIHGADDRVHLPVTDLLAQLDGSRALGDVTLSRETDAVRLAGKEGLQPRANERPAVGCSEELGGPFLRWPNDDDAILRTADRIVATDDFLTVGQE